MAALNQSETESLSLAMRAFDNIARDLQRALDAAASSDGLIMLDRDHVEEHIKTAKAAGKAVHAVKQMKGYYPS